ncbi:hypothetical protein WDW37_19415, partial [Bdellovibrionota bacterium FG-1]
MKPIQALIIILLPLMNASFSSTLVAASELRPSWIDLRPESDEAFHYYVGIGAQATNENEGRTRAFHSAVLE